MNASLRLPTALEGVGLQVAKEGPHLAVTVVELDGGPSYGIKGVLGDAVH